MSVALLSTKDSALVKGALTDESGNFSIPSVSEGNFLILATSVVIVQDKVTLGGNKNVQVWIDGKPSPYTDMNEALRNMPGDQIDRIELISQPGAQFDAAGGPILNIILKRNAELGFTGTATMTLGGFVVDHSDVNAEKRNYYRLNPSVTMNYKSGILNLFGNIAYNQGNYFTTITTDRLISNQVFRGSSLDETDYDYKNLRLGADIYATKKSTFGVILRGWGRNAVGDAHSLTNAFMGDGATQLNSFITDNLSTSKRSGYSSNFNFKHEIDAKTPVLKLKQA